MNNNKHDKLDQPLASIIIPCYNYGRYLQQAVASGRRSSYPHIEIIIINDGSDDQHTLKILQQLQQPLAGQTPVTVIHQPNQGLAAARNAGFAAAAGKYVLPLDADDLIAPSLIATAVALLETTPEISFVYSDVQMFGDQNYTWHTGAYHFTELLQHNFIPATALVRKKAWQQVGGYDEQMRFGYEDWEFWLNLGRQGHHGYKISGNLFHYRQHRHSMLGGSNKHRRQLIKYIHQKHRDIYSNPGLRVKMVLVTAKNHLPRYLLKHKVFVIITDTVNKVLRKIKLLRKR